MAKNLTMYEAVHGKDAKVTKLTKATKVIKSPKTVSETIAKIAKKAAKDIKQVSLDAGADNIAANLGHEWKTTPNLEGVLETNGLGDFRNPTTGQPIVLKARNPKKANQARTINVKTLDGDLIVVSLQKFVALVYHSNLNGSIATKVVDGNRDNLSRENVQWSKSGNYKY